MTIFRMFGASLLLVASAANAQQTPKDAIVVPLMSQALVDYPGKEAVVITVDYPPGAVDPVHRHDAHAFIYVLEGSIEMGVRGKEAVTLNPGQTFYEGPTDVHTIGRNASQTESAKFLVVLLKDADKPVAMPAH